MVDHFSLVDESQIFWNTFFAFVIEWAPKLRVVYSEEEIKINRSD